jgi:hypothetical protein
MELTLSGRLHEVIRQNSIRTIYEALVELVTNSEDAYSRVNKSRRDIWIEIKRHSELAKTSVNVIDQARGMTKTEMVDSLLTVGGYTATEGSRGFIGRGCKDCSFLGDITFTCIREGKINKLVIYQTRTVEILIDDIEVTEEHRKLYNISENGCHVNLVVAESLVPPIETFYDSLKNNVYLRNIYSNSLVIVKEKEVGFDKRVTFTYPERKLVVSCDYDVPGYGTTARLEIYRSKTKMPFPKSTDQRQFAINVQSSRTVFENSALYYTGDSKVQDYIFNPNIQFISGTLWCDKIEQLAKDAIEGKITPENPYLVIDPNRRNGLMKDHPFTAALYRYAYYMLSIVIERVQDTREEDLLGDGNASDILKSLSDFVNELIPGSSTMYAFRTHEDQDKLNTLSETMKNVELDSDFLGLSWEQMQELSRNKYLKFDASNVQGNSFDISFTQDPTVTTPYNILYLPGKISMKINTKDPSISPFISINDGKVDLVNSGKSMTSIGNMVLDATTDLIVRRNIMQSQTSSLDINGFNEYQYSYNSGRGTIAPGIFSRVMSGIENFKSSDEVPSMTLT